jgi:CGNR zinc finger/Putative stress-induced transcription regulator
VRDPRPLTTEPLAIDLVNTEWIQDGAQRDLLAEPGGVATWLAGAGHPDAPRDAAPLLEARAAIRAAIVDPADRAPLNAVLAHGWVRERLGSAGPELVVEVDDERWRVPWLAARNLLDLLRTGPGRIRRCAGDRCVLHFYDASRSGQRQWCSMASCGNRAKARRHYERTRDAQ